MARNIQALMVQAIREMCCNQAVMINHYFLNLLVLLREAKFYICKTDFSQSSLIINANPGTRNYFNNEHWAHKTVNRDKNLT
jgi:hypothetical protein